MGEHQVDSILGKLTLQQKAGQCFTFGFSGSLITPDIWIAIDRLCCGGLRLTPWNTIFGHYADPHNLDDSDVDLHHGVYKDLLKAVPWYVSAAEYVKILNRLQEFALEKRGVPLHFSADQEGNLENDISRWGINLFPASMGRLATGDMKLVCAAAAATARQVRAIGIHWLHTPVADVNVNPRNPEIGIRSYSDDPRVVGECACLEAKAYHEEKVIATAKHFPGSGDSEQDSHFALPVVTADRKRLDDVELAPFRMLIREGVPTVMSAHRMYPALDPEYPASLSRRIITGLLREEMGFRGVVTTDSITMGAIVKKYGTPTASAMAIAAGSDLVLMKDETVVREKCVEELVAWVKDGRISERQLDDSIRRVLLMKQRYGLFGAGARANPDTCTLPMEDSDTIRLSREIAGRACIVLRDVDRLLPLRPEQRVLLIEQSVWLQRAANDQTYHQCMLYENMLKYSENVMMVETEAKATPKDIKRINCKIADCEIVVITNLALRGYLTQEELARNIINSGRKVILVTDTPYPSGALPEARTVLVTFSFNNRGLEAAAQVLYGKLSASGRLPVKIPAEESVASPANS